jgi:HSP20 family protein
MSITPRSMFRELETLRNRIDRLFSDMDLSPEPRADGQLVPPVDLQETETEIIVTASMPGIKPDDISVEVDNTQLVIRGQSREERDEKTGSWHVHERRFGSMYRSLTIPSAVDEGQAEAKLHDGVLEIHLPKSEVSRGKQIEVSSS